MRPTKREKNVKIALLQNLFIYLFRQWVQDGEREPRMGRVSSRVIENDGRRLLGVIEF